MGAQEKTMKYLVAGLCLMFTTSAFAGDNYDGHYTLCKAQAQIQYGSDAIIKLSKIKNESIELVVIKDGKTIVSCDRVTFALSEV